jgi:Outer membrane protein beta-barrel family/CarboxypepD_reg-like domain
MKINVVYRILIINLLLLPQLIAQSNIDRKITGIVVDSLTKGFLPNATIMLTKNDSIIMGAKSKNDGSFIVKQSIEGSYLLKIQYVGYNAKTISIDLKNKDINLLNINMSLSQIVLSEVKVLGKKPFIEFLDDRVTMNVSESITGIGGNAMDILKKAPYIMIDMNGAVTLKGKYNPQILIDGKLTNYVGDVSKLLESMPSGSIDKIEIITNPSAKYEAEGRGAGVINIKTLKGKALGWNGNVNGGIGMGEKFRYNGGIDLNYRSEKYNVFGNYNRIDFQQYVLFHLTTRINKLFMDEYNDRNIHRFNNTFKVGVDYQIDKKNTIGFLATGFENISNMTNLTDTRFMPVNSSLIDSSQITSADRKTTWNNIALNLNYVHNFNTTGKNLKIDIDYLRNNNLPNENFIIKYLDNKGLQARQASYYRNDLPSNLNLASINVDFENPLKDGKKLEMGLKLRTTWLTNDSRFDILSDNIWVKDTRRSNLYEYQENVNAGYINYKTKLKNVNLTMGIRMENTNLEGFSVTQNESLTRNYVQFFPNISFQKELDKNNNIRLSYQQSISRPSYEQFNPFVVYHTNYSNSKGNPALTPAIDNTISLDYDYRKKLFISLNNSVTKGIIGYIPRINPETKVLSYIFENFDYTNNLYLNIIYNTNITKWWQTNSELALYYQSIKGTYNDVEFAKTNPYFGFTYSNTFTLGKGYTAELSGAYNSRWAQTVFYGRPFQNIDIGFSKSILNNQGSLKFNVTDIFNQLNYIAELAVINQVHQRKPETRYFRLNFSYKFGNNNVKKSRNRQTGLSSESRRISN